MKSWLLAVALVPARRHPRQCRIVSESEHQINITFIITTTSDSAGKQILLILVPILT